MPLVLNFENQENIRFIISTKVLTINEETCNVKLCIEHRSRNQMHELILVDNLETGETRKYKMGHSRFNELFGKMEE